MSQAKTNSDDKLKFYDIRPALSAGVIGESYAVTAYRVRPQAPDTAEVEFAILITRPQPKLLTGSVVVPHGSLPEGLGHYGVEEIHVEGVALARFALMDFLAERATELERPALADVYPEFRLLERRPLVSAWFHNKWHAEIKRLAKDAVTEALSDHCKLIVQHLRPIVAAPGR